MPLPIRCALLAVLLASPLAGQRLESSRYSRVTPQQPDTAKQPLPQGFYWNQVGAGAKVGGIGALIGLSAGLVVVRLDGSWSGNELGDALNTVFIPLTGALLGYAIAAPIGVWRYSERAGYKAPFIATFAGGVVGSLGILAFGFPMIFTIPMGSAWAHNAARQ